MLPSEIKGLLDAMGFSYNEIVNSDVYFCDLIQKSIDENNPVIGTVRTSAGLHEVFVTSYDTITDNFIGYDPRTGTLVHIPNYSLSNIYEITGK